MQVVGDADGPSRFLHLRMRALSPDEARPRGRDPVLVAAWVVVGTAAAPILLVDAATDDSCRAR